MPTRPGFPRRTPTADAILSSASIELADETGVPAGADDQVDIGRERRVAVHGAGASLLVSVGGDALRIGIGIKTGVGIAGAMQVFGLDPSTAPGTSRPPSGS